MVPAADCKHSQLSMDESFFLTNVVPQDIDNNGGYAGGVEAKYSPSPITHTHTHTHSHAHTHKHSYWNRLEMFCRDLTNVYDEVRVISGPLFLVEEDNTTGKSLVKYEVGTATDALVLLGRGALLGRRWRSSFLKLKQNFTVSAGDREESCCSANSSVQDCFSRVQVQPHCHW